MIRKVVGRIQILPLAIAFAAAIFAGDSLVRDPNEACAQALATGCAQGGSLSVSAGGFDANNYDLTDVAVDNGKLVLQTGTQALDPSNIVIPFDQDVSAVFQLEGAGFESDFGWFLRSEADQKVCGSPGCITGPLNFSTLTGAGVTINYLFRKIKDDQETGGCCSGGDGVLDKIYNDSTGALLWSGSTASLTEAALTTYGFSPNNDGAVDPRDMRKFMGNFTNGTEIVFFMHPNGDQNQTFFSKNGWSWDVWSPGYVSPGGASIGWATYARDKAGRQAGATPFTQKFELDYCAPDTGTACTSGNFTTGLFSPAGCCPPAEFYSAIGSCTTSNYSTTKCQSGKQGWIGLPAISRMSTYFGVTLTGEISSQYTWNTGYNHFIVGAPPSDPFKWILGIEDYPNSGDADFNDLVIMIERKTGGLAQLKSTQAISPPDADAYITSVTFGVHDLMPAASCGLSAGATQIDYYLSIDNGGNWVKVTTWDSVTTPDKNGAAVTGWTYGNPEETYRLVTVNFTELGLTGRELVWKAQMLSSDDSCKPEITEVDLSFEAAKNTEFSRSAPSILANVIYDATFETPAPAWVDRDLRGHLVSQTLYNPEFPSAGYNIVNNWDAGAVVTAAGPGARNVLMPNVTINTVVNETIATGDGTTKTFTGTLAHSPVVHSTLSISDGVETFTDMRTEQLEGSLTGTGTINRFTGEFTLTFKTAPANGSAIQADYQWYTSTSAMLQFNPGNVNADMLALDASTYIDGTGTHYTYDFNSDGNFTEGDADWLVNWTLGYRDGVAVSKEWLLGAIDHSTPAVIGAPGLPGWYYGSDVTTTDRDTFDQFRCTNRTRKTVAFAGARDGMMHGFYAGEYRPYYVNESMLDPLKPNECDSANINTFRGAPGTTQTGAINTLTLTDAITGSKIPYYPGNTVSGAKQIIISRGYYDWKTRAGANLVDAGAPNYGDGSEGFAVVPLNLLGKLKNNKLQGEDRAMVDASPAVAHVKFRNAAGNPWKTVMISAEGNGGDTVFALDITNPDSPLFLWEFADPDLYRSRSSPSVGPIGRIQTTSGERWVTFFVSGVNNDPTLYPSIYMLDVETGEVLDRIYLDSIGGGVGGSPSAQPAIIDSDGNGFIDRMFIGTDKGYVYKITIPDNPGAMTYNLSVCTFFDAGQPIYASPTVMVRNTVSSSGQLEYKVDVFFGTSDSPYQNDAVDPVYYFYAVRDSNTKGVCTSGAQLWSMALPAGQKVFATAFATAGRIYFGTTSAGTEDPCSTDAAGAAPTGFIYALDAETGADAGAGPISVAGGVTVSPVVEDEHLYIKSGSGSLEGRGGNNFQNELKKGGFGSVSVSSWSEVFID